jgi:predicted outer membrane repeat protein
VELNQANGATGIGGGIYTLGTFTNILNLFLGNHASTSGDDIGP